MKIYILLLLIASVASTPLYSSNDDFIKNILSNSKISLTFLGQVANKLYFIDADKEMVSWMAAREICAESGMKMGEYNSEEYQFIRETIRYPDNPWVGGSLKGMDDYTLYESLEWQSGPQLTSGINVEFSSSKWLCTYYEGDHTYIDFCINGSHQVLCQVVL